MDDMILFGGVGGGEIHLPEIAFDSQVKTKQPLVLLDEGKDRKKNTKKKTRPYFSRVQPEVRRSDNPPTTDSPFCQQLTGNVEKGDGRTKQRQKWLSNR